MPHSPHRGSPEAADLAPFPCFWLCLECGRLHPPEQVAGASSPRVCVACRRPALADLRPNGAIVALARIDEEDAPARASRGHRLLSRALGYGIVAGALGMIAVLVWAIVVAHTLDPIYISLWLVCLMPLLLTAGTILSRRLAGSQAKPLPARWLMSLASGSRRRGARIQGRPAAAELLRAPLSGRPCVAYEVGARRDRDADDAELGSWLLLEQRSAAFVIGEVSVAADRAALSLRPRAHFAGDDAPDPAARDRFLRERGILSTEPIELFETIVAADDECVLRIGEGAPVLERARLRALPRAG
ncbi:MAG: hypothetical protein H6711_06475 [Myxococcales bacterium]|nr:hypothetical protein [Myxococcales bacterium]